MELLDPRIGAVPPQDFDWNSLLNAAVFHGVFPIVHRQCSGAETTKVPKEFLWKLSAYVLQNQERCRQLQKEWLEILELFHRRNIPVIPVKGFWLAESVYGDSFLRNFTDLDYFVKESDLDRSKEALRSAGYSLQQPSCDEYERNLRRTQYEIGFTRGDTLVELQYRFAPRILSLNIDSNEVWKRAKLVRIHDIPAFQMSMEDTFLYLCIHAWKHGWSRAKWICDVAELLNMAGKENAEGLAIDWDVVVQRARESRIEGIILDTLLLTRPLLHPEMPGGLMDRLGGAPSSALRAKTGIPGDFGSKWDEARHWIVYRPRFADRFKMGLSFLYPTETDFQTVPLPQSLFFMYYFLRPFLLARKLVLLLFRSSQNQGTCR